MGPGKTSEVEGTYTEQLQDGEKLIFQTFVLVIETLALVLSPKDHKTSRNPL